MIDVLLRMLLWVTLGLALVLLLRRPVRRLFGAGPAFMLWLLPLALMLAPLLPYGVTPVSVWPLPVTVVTPHAEAIARVAAPLDWGWWLCAAWLVGALAGLVRLVLHYLRLRRGMHRIPTEWAGWLAQAVPSLDLRRVRVHDFGPAVLWALPRAVILLPVDFAARFGDTATRELVLRHELTHARRGDACWNLAMEIVSALLWFHPLVWVARRCFRLDQELACDAASLRVMPKREGSYARALLDSVAVQPVPALIPWLAEPQLKERIAMITRIPPGALRRRTGFAAITVLLAGSLLAAGATTFAQASPPAAATPVQIHGQMAVFMPPTTGATSTQSPPSVTVVIKRHNPPSYPIKALHNDQQGTVILDVTVDASGNITGINVDEAKTTAPPILQSAALQAAARWKFNPGLKDGEPVGGTVRIPVRFSLQPVTPCKHGEAYATKLSQCVKLKAVRTSS